MGLAVGWQRFEGALIFLSVLGLVGWTGSPLAVWALVLIFFAPDLTIAGYVFGPRVGAVAYNLAHLYGMGTVVFMVGVLCQTDWAVTAGALWLAHAGFDRMLGYGLKLPQGFQATHLGRIGKASARD